MTGLSKLLVASLAAAAVVDVCAANQVTECNGDGDCPTTQWCREKRPEDLVYDPECADPTWGVCVDYAGQGRTCGGFVPSWANEICADGLICDANPMIADIPGTCLSRCDYSSTSKECGEEQYCARDGVCRAYGSCRADGDCDEPRNLYIKPRCIGSGECSMEGSCHWRCSHGDISRRLGVKN
eukprot:GFYU01000788.1.p1 GENE.GFYU01000788.1~~GFYU01000788.1.p1  ORF type:complete len:183 (+),score=32.60 GFYU01000788.1:48-596(+)